MKTPHVFFSGLLSALALTIGMIAGPGTATAATTSRAAPPFCAGSGPIPAAAVSSPLNLATCPIQGRTLVMSFNNGRPGPEVRVPGTGLRLTTDILTTSGDYMLSAANNYGYLTVRQSRPPAHPAAASPAASTDVACAESDFAYTGYYWNQTDKYYINQSTISQRTNLDAAAAVTNLRDGNYNMTTGQNNCGWATGVFKAYGAYQGDTTKYANITSDATPSSNFPDGQNTLSFGPFSSTALANGDLAVTAVQSYTASGVVQEADIYFGSNVGLQNACAFPFTGSTYDLQSIATHEWGHAYGLDHEYTGFDEVMYPTARPCPQQRRHLGDGDYAAMKALYP